MLNHLSRIILFIFVACFVLTSANATFAQFYKPALKDKDLERTEKIISAGKGALIPKGVKEFPGVELCLREESDAPARIISAICNKTRECLPEVDSSIHESCNLRLSYVDSSQLWYKLGVDELERATSLTSLLLTRMISNEEVIVRPDKVCSCLDKISDLSCDTIEHNFNPDDYTWVAGVLGSEATCQSAFSHGSRRGFGYDHANLQAPLGSLADLLEGPSEASTFIYRRGEGTPPETEILAHLGFSPSELDHFVRFEKYIPAADSTSDPIYLWVYILKGMFFSDKPLDITSDGPEGPHGKGRSIHRDRLWFNSILTEPFTVSQTGEVLPVGFYSSSAVFDVDIELHDLRGRHLILHIDYDQLYSYQRLHRISNTLLSRPAVFIAFVSFDLE